MANNTNLHKAKSAKKDEFYTQLSDIERELVHYRKHFKDKVVLCNCDDPFESNFFKYFALNFNILGLKKLICTSYANSPVAGEQLSLFSDEEKKRRTPYKAIVTRVHDANGDGGVGISDIKLLFENGENTLEELQGDGDFRSDECISLLQEADIVVTNPPFSLFREYVAQLMEHGKKFIVIGNMNAITYKEVFPLIKDNQLWLGATQFNTGMYFYVPDDFVYKASYHFLKEIDGRAVNRVPSVCWFTNLDIRKRHEELLLTEIYCPEKYPKYDNYDAIEVSKVADIPCDYEECYLVPVKYEERLRKAGLPVNSKRLNSKGEPCVSLSLSLSKAYRQRTWSIAAA